MNFLKFLCCRDTLQANFTIGDIKQSSSGTTCLEVEVKLSVGIIRPNTDFLYLSTDEDRENLPKRLKEVSKDLVLSI